MWSSRAACLQTVGVVASQASRAMLLCSVKGVRFGEGVGDLLGEVPGAGGGRADGGDDGSVAAPQPDEPGLSGGPSSGGGRAGVDLDGDGRHGWSPLSGGSGTGRMLRPGYWVADKTGKGRSGWGGQAPMRSRPASSRGSGRRPANRSQASMDAAAG